MAKKKKIVVQTHKKKKSKKKHEFSAFKLSIVFICISLVIVGGSFAMYQIINMQQKKTLVPKLTPGKNGVATPSTEDEDADVTLRQSQNLTSEEVKKLHSLGYSDEDITMQPTIYWYRVLYGSERYIQEAYMSRYKSPYTGADEPTDDQRNELFSQMLTAYAAGNYSLTVQDFQNSLRTTTFENYKDEPITSLYHDAVEKITILNNNSTDTESDFDDIDSTNKVIVDVPDSLTNNRKLVDKSLDDHQSAIALLYDMFNLDATLTTAHLADDSSCTPINPLASITSTTVYDMHKMDTQTNIPLEPASKVPHKEAIDPAADVVYVYKCVDDDGNTVTAIIQSIEIQKEIVGIYYDNSDACLYKSGVQTRN